LGSIASAGERFREPVTNPALGSDRQNRRLDADLVAFCGTLDRFVAVRDDHMKAVVEKMHRARIDCRALATPGGPQTAHTVKRAAKATPSIHRQIKDLEWWSRGGSNP
jgi:hypothetical protein